MKLRKEYQQYKPMDDKELCRIANDITNLFCKEKVNTYDAIRVLLAIAHQTAQQMKDLGINCELFAMFALGDEQVDDLKKKLPEEYQA